LCLVTFVGQPSFTPSASFGDDLPLEPQLDASAERLGDEQPTPEEVRRDVERIQRALGGSVVEQFPTLRKRPRTGEIPESWQDDPSGPGSPQQPWSGFRPRVEPTEASLEADPERRRVEERRRAEERRTQARRVAELRRIAGDADDAANRMESLELYEEADGLRQVAQRLRLRARSLAALALPADGPGLGDASLSGFGPPAWPNDEWMRSGRLNLRKPNPAAQRANNRQQPDDRKNPPSGSPGVD
jgi:hypothetical protein